MFSLSGKTALITGATGGIGQAIAKVFHQQGAQVILCGRKKEVLDQLVGDLGDRAQACCLDIASPSFEEDMAAIPGGIQNVDILVNNAGMTKDNIALLMTEDEWQNVLDVDLTGPFKLSRAVLRGMMKKRWGRIINISSVVAVTGSSGQANYCAAKAGLIAMSKALAREMASRNITVNCVAPGYIPTNMTEVLPDSVKEASLSLIPLKRPGTPEEVAAAVLFLASQEAAYVTGETIHVNGGMAMI